MSWLIYIDRRAEVVEFSLFLALQISMVCKAPAEVQEDGLEQSISDSIENSS